MATEFLQLVRPREVIGQLPSLRVAPLGVRVLREVDGAVGFWVGQGQAKPLTSAALDSVELAPLKVVAMTVVTREVLRLAPSQAEPIITQMLARACAQVANEAFLSDAADVPVCRRPASCPGRRLSPRPATCSWTWPRWSRRTRAASILRHSS